MTNNWGKGLFHHFATSSVYACLVAQSCPTPCDPWTAAWQAPLSMGFSREDYYSGLPFPTPEDIPDSRMEPASPELAGGSFTKSATWKPLSPALGGVIKKQVSVSVFFGHASGHAGS